MFINDVLDGFSVERGEAGGGGDIAFADFEDALHIILFERVRDHLFSFFEGDALIDDILEGRGEEGALFFFDAAGIFFERGGIEEARFNAIGAGEDARAFDKIAEFADIARPGVGL